MSKGEVRPRVLRTIVCAEPVQQAPSVTSYKSNTTTVNTAVNVEQPKKVKERNVTLTQPNTQNGNSYNQSSSVLSSSEKALTENYEVIDMDLDVTPVEHEVIEHEVVVSPPASPISSGEDSNATWDVRPLITDDDGITIFESDDLITRTLKKLILLTEFLNTEDDENDEADSKQHSDEKASKCSNEIEKCDNVNSDSSNQSSYQPTIERKNSEEKQTVKVNEHSKLKENLLNEDIFVSKCSKSVSNVKGDNTSEEIFVSKCSKSFSNVKGDNTSKSESLNKESCEWHQRDKDLRIIVTNHVKEQCTTKKDLKQGDTSKNDQAKSVDTCQSKSSVTVKSTNQLPKEQILCSVSKSSDSETNKCSKPESTINMSEPAVSEARTATNLEKGIIGTKNTGQNITSDINAKSTSETESAINDNSTLLHQSKLEGPKLEEPKESIKSNSENDVTFIKVESSENTVTKSHERNTGLYKVNCESSEHSNVNPVTPDTRIIVKMEGTHSNNPELQKDSKQCNVRHFDKRCSSESENNVVVLNSDSENDVEIILVEVQNDRSVPDDEVIVIEDSPQKKNIKTIESSSSEDEPTLTLNSESEDDTQNKEKKNMKTVEKNSSEDEPTMTLSSESEDNSQDKEKANMKTVENSSSEDEPTMTLSSESDDNSQDKEKANMKTVENNSSEDEPTMTLSSESEDNTHDEERKSSKDNDTNVEVEGKIQTNSCNIGDLKELKIVLTDCLLDGRVAEMKSTSEGKAGCDDGRQNNPAEDVEAERPVKQSEIQIDTSSKDVPKPKRIVTIDQADTESTVKLSSLSGKFEKPLKKSEIRTFGVSRSITDGPRTRKSPTEHEIRNKRKVWINDSSTSESENERSAKTVQSVASRVVMVCRNKSQDRRSREYKDSVRKEMMRETSHRHAITVERGRGSGTLMRNINSASGTERTESIKERGRSSDISDNRNSKERGRSPSCKDRERYDNSSRSRKRERSPDKQRSSNERERSDNFRNSKDRERSDSSRSREERGRSDNSRSSEERGYSDNTRNRRERAISPYKSRSSKDRGRSPDTVKNSNNKGYSITRLGSTGRKREERNHPNSVNTLRSNERDRNNENSRSSREKDNSPSRNERSRGNRERNKSPTRSAGTRRSNDTDKSQIDTKRSSNIESARRREKSPIRNNVRSKSSPNRTKRTEKSPIRGSQSKRRRRISPANSPTNRNERNKDNINPTCSKESSIDAVCGWKYHRCSTMDQHYHVLYHERRKRYERMSVQRGRATSTRREIKSKDKFDIDKGGKNVPGIEKEIQSLINECKQSGARCHNKGTVCDKTKTETQSVNNGTQGEAKNSNEKSEVTKSTCTNSTAKRDNGQLSKPKTNAANLPKKPFKCSCPVKCISKTQHNKRVKLRNKGLLMQKQTTEVQNQNAGYDLKVKELEERIKTLEREKQEILEASRMNSDDSKRLSNQQTLSTASNSLASCDSNPRSKVPCKSFLSKWGCIKSFRCPFLHAKHDGNSSQPNVKEIPLLLYQTKGDNKASDEKANCYKETKIDNKAKINVKANQKEGNLKNADSDIKAASNSNGNLNNEFLPQGQMQHDKIKQGADIEGSPIKPKIDAADDTGVKNLNPASICVTPGHTCKSWQQHWKMEFSPNTKTVSSMRHEANKGEKSTVSATETCKISNVSNVNNMSLTVSSNMCTRDTTNKVRVTEDSQIRIPISSTKTTTSSSLTRDSNTSITTNTLETMISAKGCVQSTSANHEATSVTSSNSNNTLVTTTTPKTLKPGVTTVSYVSPLGTANSSGSDKPVINKETVRTPNDSLATSNTTNKPGTANTGTICDITTKVKVEPCDSNIPVTSNSINVKSLDTRSETSVGVNSKAPVTIKAEEPKLTDTEVTETSANQTKTSTPVNVCVSRTTDSTEMTKSITTNGLSSNTSETKDKDAFKTSKGGKPAVSEAQVTTASDASKTSTTFSNSIPSVTVTVTASKASVSSTTEASETLSSLNKTSLDSKANSVTTLIQCTSNSTSATPNIITSVPPGKNTETPPNSMNSKQPLESNTFDTSKWTEYRTNAQNNSKNGSSKGKVVKASISDTGVKSNIAIAKENILEKQKQYNPAYLKQCQDLVVVDEITPDNTAYQKQCEDLVIVTNKSQPPRHKQDYITKKRMANTPNRKETSLSPAFLQQCQDMVTVGTIKGPKVDKKKGKPICRKNNNTQPILNISATLKDMSLMNTSSNVFTKIESTDMKNQRIFGNHETEAASNNVLDTSLQGDNALQPIGTWTVKSEIGLLKSEDIDILKKTVVENLKHDSRENQDSLTNINENQAEITTVKSLDHDTGKMLCSPSNKNSQTSHVQKPKENKQVLEIHGSKKKSAEDKSHSKICSTKQETSVGSAKGNEKLNCDDQTKSSDQACSVEKVNNSAQDIGNNKNNGENSKQSEPTGRNDNTSQQVVGNTVTIGMKRKAGSDPDDAPTSKILCKNYLSKWGCLKSFKCPFLHSKNDENSSQSNVKEIPSLLHQAKCDNMANSDEKAKGESDSSSKIPCKNFLSKWGCLKSFRCPFLHSKSDGNASHSNITEIPSLLHQAKGINNAKSDEKANSDKVTQLDNKAKSNVKANQKEGNVKNDSSNNRAGNAAQTQSTETKDKNCQQAKGCTVIPHTKEVNTSNYIPTSKIPCRFFRSRYGCMKSTKCPFLHSDTDDVQRTSQSRLKDIPSLLDPGKCDIKSRSGDKAKCDDQENAHKNAKKGKPDSRNEDENSIQTTSADIKDSSDQLASRNSTYKVKRNFKQINEIPCRYYRSKRGCANSIFCPFLHSQKLGAKKSSPLKIKAMPSPKKANSDGKIRNEGKSKISDKAKSYEKVKRNDKAKTDNKTKGGEKSASDGKARTDNKSKSADILKSVDVTKSIKSKTDIKTKTFDKPKTETSKTTKGDEKSKAVDRSRSDGKCETKTIQKCESDIKPKTVTINKSNDKSKPGDDKPKKNETSKTVVIGVKRKAVGYPESVSTSKIPCRYFRSIGGCRMKSMCAFLHSYDSEKQQSSSFNTKDIPSILDIKQPLLPNPRTPSRQEQLVRRRAPAQQYHDDGNQDFANQSWHETHHQRQSNENCEHSPPLLERLRRAQRNHLLTSYSENDGYDGDESYAQRNYYSRASVERDGYQQTVSTEFDEQYECENMEFDRQYNRDGAELHRQYQPIHRDYDVEYDGEYVQDDREYDRQYVRDEREYDRGHHPDSSYESQYDRGHHPDSSYESQYDRGHHPDSSYESQYETGHHPDSPNESQYERGHHHDSSYESQVDRGSYHPDSSYESEYGAYNRYERPRHEGQQYGRHWDY